MRLHLVGSTDSLLCRNINWLWPKWWWYVLVCFINEIDWSKLVRLSLYEWAMEHNFNWHNIRRPRNHTSYTDRADSVLSFRSIDQKHDKNYRDGCVFSYVLIGGRNHYQSFIGSFGSAEWLHLHTHTDNQSNVWAGVPVWIIISYCVRAWRVNELNENMRMNGINQIQQV